MYTDDSASDDEETQVHEQNVEEGIRSGTLVVKIWDDTYKCPLSPGRKKQSYKYRELLAHATGVASGKKGPEKVGGHRALMKYLQAELGDKPMIPQAERVLYLEQAVPKREVIAIKFLAPWMGILVNIDNSRTNEKEFRVAANIKEKFKEYNPARVDVFLNYRKHQVTALLTFKNDIHGLEDAQAFERSFAAVNRGSKQWWSEERHANLDLYGWQATEEDLSANLGQLTEHLKKVCDLKTVKDMVEEKERINKQIVDDLVKTVDKKNDVVVASYQQLLMLRNIVDEVEALRVKSEEEKKRMEEQHKRDLEEMLLQSEAKEAAHNQKLLSHQVTLTNKLQALEQLCEAMKVVKVQMKQKNEAERQQFQREQQDGENKGLEIAVEEETTELIQKKQLELQEQNLKMEISTETDKEKIAELESEQETLQEMVSALSIKE